MIDFGFVEDHIGQHKKNLPDRRKKSALEQCHIAYTNSKENDHINTVLLRSEGWVVPMISPSALSS